MILDRPNLFGWVQIILDGSNSFRTAANHCVQVQITFLWTNFYNSDLSKTICMVQNDFGPIEGQGISKYLIVNFVISGILHLQYLLDDRH